MLAHHHEDDDHHSCDDADHNGNYRDVAGASREKTYHNIKHALRQFRTHWQTSRIAAWMLVAHFYFDMFCSAPRAKLLLIYNFKQKMRSDKFKQTENIARFCTTLGANLYLDLMFFFTNWSATLFDMYVLCVFFGGGGGELWIGDVY